ncbi:MAG: PL29 family lyase N-terminal domain-containing protein [Candidatus Cryptobacteroides sp.]
MKNLNIIIAMLSLAVVLVCCTNLEDVRKDIDDMNSRLDALEASLGGYNEGINNLYRMTVGTIFVTGYTVNEKGDAVLTLSDGTSMTIYAGLPLVEIPIVAINEDGFWTYTFEEETIVLVDGDANPLSALPQDGVDGHVPYISIDSDGYWCINVDGVTTRIDGKYNFADISKIPGSIFADVKVNGNELVITLLSGDITRIPLLGGLDIVFPEGGVIVKTGESVTVTATINEVADVVLDPTPLKIVLTDDATDNLTVNAAGVPVGEYQVHFQIFSATGYRLVKTLNVSVVE